ncbi:uncharacterized protein HaLaN_14310 [Haematococcus lacustris]|uniref:Uncharacterized protein n=1 Tax=Haematococcus lacustris TaxID=44745 RepID=A0A699ZEP3_HAELA|nr:uncharacterized protein HaLaN_14310 [Haematococcus lacustris]
MVRRMMPTVGCEADAVAFTEESGVLKTVGLGTVGASLGATTSGGSGDGGSGGNDNIHGSGGVVLAGSGRVVKEPWLALLATEEDGSYIAAAAPQEGGNLASSGQPGMWSAHSIEVHIERWLRDYTGALDLCGCGGGLSAFASTFVTRPDAGVELDDDGIAADAPWR